MSLSYLFPLIAAVFYTIATLFLKRSMSLGAGPMRIVFIANLLAVPIIAPVLLVFGTEVYDASLWWAALVCALGNFGGLVLTFVAVRVGDLSVQTPVMGVKVIIVGVFAVIMGAGPIPLQWWLGAGLSVLAVYILSMPDSVKSKRSKTLILTIFLCLACSACFALCDVVMEKYARAFGEGPFLVLTVALTAALSFFLIPFYDGSLRSIPRASFIWGLIGALLMGLEALCLYGSISFYGQATAANILYSSRGIWSIIFIFLLGPLFGNTECSVGKKVMIRRSLGSLMLFAAIVLVLTS